MFQSEFFLNDKGILINDEGIILIEEKRTNFRESSTSFLSYHFFFKLFMTNCRKRPVSHRKCYSFLSSEVSLPQKWSCPQKIIFYCYFVFFCIFFLFFFVFFVFFLKKLLDEKIFKTSFSIKKVIFTCGIRWPCVLKMVMSFKHFFRYFLGKCCFLQRNC